MAVKYRKIGNGFDVHHGGNHRSPHPTPRAPRPIKVYGAYTDGKDYSVKDSRFDGSDDLIISEESNG